MEWHIDQNEFLKQQLELLRERQNPDSDIEWQDVSDARTAYSGDIEHRDTVRKGSKLLYEYLNAGWNINEPNSKPVDSDGIQIDTSEIDIKIKELQKERYKNQATKIELNRLNRQESRFELFYDNIKDSIESFPTPHFEYDVNCVNSNNREYVLSLADIHAGSKFKSENNEYSMEICEQRFAKLFNDMVDYIQKNNINKLKIIGLGDDIQGILRVSDLQLNETSVVEATVFVSKLIASFLNDLSNHTYIEYYHVPTANHSQSRNLGTKASELASEDLEYVIGNYIKDLLVNNDRVTVNFNFGHEYITVPIFDFNVIAMHGHQVNTIQNALKDLSMLHRKFYDYLFLAHFHSSTEMTVGEGSTNDTEVLVCPSFIGSCPYSDKIMKGAKASCKVFVFDEINGHVGTDKIILN